MNPTPSSSPSAATKTPLSMTGFGSAEATLGAQKYRLEIRSVNHRYLDLKIRLPREFQAYDSQIRALVQSRVQRGALEFKLEKAVSDNSPSAPLSLQVDLPLARQVHSALELIRKELQIETPITVRDVAQFHQVLQLDDPTGDSILSGSTDFWDTQLSPLVHKAIHELMRMREREGENLGSILRAGMDEIRSVITEIRRLRQNSEKELRTRLSEKLKKILEAYPLEPVPSQTLLETRLAQELAFALERTDIQEELDRFSGHIDHFCKTLSGEQQLGRKLEFILQELGREMNTLGNKAQDLGISQLVVATKVRLEQLREQVLNLA